MTDHFRWMEDPGIGRLRLDQVTFPGTHDSGTWELGPDSPIAPDADTQQFVLDLQKNFAGDAERTALFNSVVAGWMKAQGRDFTKQLEFGIRYFDLRVYSHGGVLYLVHTMYQTKLESALADIGAFVSAHPSELVVLYFQHFYAMSDSDHQQLIASLRSTFGDALMGSTTPLSVTVKALQDSRQRVMVVYGEDAYAGANADLWPASTLDLPWPQGKETADEVLAFLQQELARPHSDTRLFGLLGTITPDEKIVMEGLKSQFSGDTSDAPRTLEQLAATINQPFVDWLRTLSPGEPVSFAIIDWYDRVDLIDVVIEMNRRRAAG